MSGTVLAVGLLAVAHVDVPNTLSLTSEERAWINKHPVIRVVVDPKWKPVQYIENGVYKGLASEYLAAISHRTGLQFKWVAEEHYSLVADRLQKGEVDMLPVVQRQFAPPEIARFITFSVPYYAGTTLAVTGDHAPVIFELARLVGKRVAVRVGGAYQARLGGATPKRQHTYPIICLGHCDRSFLSESRCLSTGCSATF
jgi:two-component system sensor histidine kinase EvgS